ncbi:hypothetical protein [Bradyrhizobium sp. CCBAU 21365]|uniref:hypothetical protein n=1 Tax=Bradyrhizobium sp. CCBAU 21365 TaxID=1325083 RepID=UPI00188A1714|nr:hypothetical protein [Bradyrhizobium sp. CCBAU 21365]
MSRLVNRVAAIGAAAASAALLAYFREQFAEGLKWLVSPIIRRLPWHREALAHSPQHGLSSNLTIADLFLLTTDGKRAVYAKAGDYVVGSEPLSSYFEGVTTSGDARNFATEMGVILETKTEHGFHVSEIDLGALLPAGTHFHNEYRAELYDSFTSEEEHWTQEIALPTKHFTLRVHFPKKRPPILLRCKRLVGLAEYQMKTSVRTATLFGRPSVMWEIKEPQLGEIYKLEWRW